MPILPSNSYYSTELTSEGRIRLLKIQSEADGSREIQCELVTVCLKDSPNYIALSYTWGPPTPEAADRGVTNSAKYAIKCNGDVTLITQNLHDFFRRVQCDSKLNSQWF